jgi:vacuolar protein sorting-associated protein 53
METIKFDGLSQEVQDVLQHILQSEDPLDRSDFNTSDYINQLFPNEIALNGIEEIINKMQIEVEVIDENIRSVVKGVSTSGTEGKQALDEAKKTIQQLLISIGDIKSRAEVTEQIVRRVNFLKNISTILTFTLIISRYKR